MKTIKTILIFSFFLFTFSSSFSQDSNFYSVTYLDAEKNEQTIEGIKVTNIYNNLLCFQKSYNKGDNITPPSTENYCIKLINITEFGYKIPTKVWKRVLIAGLVGAGTGALLGYVAEGFSGWEHSSKSRIHNGALIGGIIGGLAGSAFGGMISIGAQDYEETDISQYSTTKKYSTIKNLIKKGIINDKYKDE